MAKMYLSFAPNLADVTSSMLNCYRKKVFICLRLRPKRIFFQSQGHNFNVTRISSSLLDPCKDTDLRVDASKYGLGATRPQATGIDYAEVYTELLCSLKAHDSAITEVQL